MARGELAGGAASWVMVGGSDPRSKGIPMRRALAAFVLSASVVMTGAAVVAPAQAAPNPVLPENFGMHIPGIASGEATLGE